MAVALRRHLLDTACGRRRLDLPEPAARGSARASLAGPAAARTPTDAINRFIARR